MKLVENILGYIQEQFYRFSRGCKPQETTLKCPKHISFLGNKKSILNQKVHFASFLSGGFFYSHSSKFTGKETGKTHLCVMSGVIMLLCNSFVAFLGFGQKNWPKKNG
jgi:hypothetical protein